MLASFYLKLALINDHLRVLKFVGALETCRALTMMKVPKTLSFTIESRHSLLSLQYSQNHLKRCLGLESVIII